MSTQGHLEAIYPLSPSQLGMWLQSFGEQRTGLFIEQTAWALEGELKVDALTAAWQVVSDRHAALRSAILSKGSEPVQAVLRHLPVQFRHEQARAEDEETAVTSMMRREREGGFRLNRPPLIRFAILGVRPRRAWFILTFHHIILDGWSLPLLWSEAAAAYSCLSTGKLVPNEPLPDYGRFIAWMRSKSQAAAELYWRSLFRTFPAVAETAGGPCPAMGSETSEFEIRLAAASGAALSRLVRDCAVSAATVMEALWALVLARRTGTRDVVFGVTVSGRPSEVPEIERMVGFFINTVPVRVRFEATTTLRELIVIHQSQRAGQAEFEYCSAGQIKAWAGTPAGTPLYRTVFVYENLPPAKSAPEESRDSGLLVAEHRVHGGRTPIPLTLLVSPGSEPHLRFIYHPACIGADEIESLARDFAGLVAHAPEWLDAILDHYVYLQAAPRVCFGGVPPPVTSHLPFIAPRTLLEEKLAGIWEELFEHGPISVLDDFFSLGGHSLMAVQMTSLINSRLNADLPLHAVVNAPTIEKQAHALSSRIPESGALVRLNAHGEAAPVFCFHPLGGNVLCYAALARRLGGIHPCWGIQAKGLRQGEEPAHSWNEIVDYHWDILPRSGPLILLGYSYGGYIAMELAARARAEGHEKIFVILLDVPHPSVIPPDQLRPGAAVLLHSLLGHSLGIDVQTLRDMPPDRMLADVRERALELHILPPDLTLEAMERLLQVAEAHSRIVPPTRHFDFRICLLRAREGASRISGLEDLGWRTYTDGVTLHWVEGSHETVLQPCNVETSAQRILEYVAR